MKKSIVFILFVVVLIPSTFLSVFSETNAPNAASIPAITEPTQFVYSNARHSSIEEIMNDSTATIVTTEAELRTALYSNNGINTVYLGADIYIPSAIVLNSGKGDVVVDGHLPTMAEGEFYTIEQAVRNGASFSLYANARLTLQNMKINCQDYYGIVYAPNANDIIQFNNVDYVGAQLVYNHGSNSLTRIIDSKIINTLNRAQAIQELVEGGSVEFEGKSYLSREGEDSRTRNMPFFYLPASTDYIKVFPDAEVTVSLSAGGPMTYLNGSDLEVGKNAKFIIYAPDGIMRNNAYNFGSVNVRSEAVLDINVDADDYERSSVLRINRDLIVEGGATVSISQSETSTSYSAIQFTTSSGRMIIDDPKLFYISVKNDSPLRFTGNNNFTITTEVVNRWTSQTQSLPDYIWNEPVNEDGEFTLSFNTYLTSTGQKVSSVSSTDFVPETGSPTLNEDFDFLGSDRLSFGQARMTPEDHLCPLTPALSGTTEGQKDIQVTYTDQSDVLKIENGTSDSAGAFRIPLTSKPKEGTYAEVISSEPKLSIRHAVEVTPTTGKLELLSVPTQFDFEEHNIPETATRYNLTNPNWQVQMLDDRCDKPMWRLQLQATPFTVTVDSQEYTLPATFYYINSNNVETPLSSSVTVFTPTSLEDTTNFSFSGSQGNAFALQVNPSGATPIIPGVTYHSTMTWTIVTAP